MPLFRTNRLAASQLDATPAERLKDDLTTGKERPLWPLSCYAPVPDVTQHLIQAKWDPNKPPTDPDQGAPEFSPEEMRYKFYMAAAAGQQEAYVSATSSNVVWCIKLRLWHR